MSRTLGLLRRLNQAVADGSALAWSEVERSVDSREAQRVVTAAFGLAESGRATGVASPASSAPEDPMRLGPYRLLQPLGEGAMGIVYEAEQEAPVRRRVALKVLKFPMPTRQALARFESERQALALMNHPHIAQVYDGGVAPDGRPYLAMEFVRGIPVTEYCDRRRLTIGERLELFVKVCEGVQHAHQKGVIHRDLKPTNILVTEIGGVAVPKVIDFGVAKAIGQQLTEKTLLTHVGHVVGTPAYMSPEQADPTGLDIDTRSDVYALGVLLYELLVGSRPFEERSGAAVSVDEMRRRIVHLDPERPSARAGAVSKSAFRRSRGPGTAPGTGSDAGPVPALGPGTHEAARLRQTEPRELARRLRGELDRVVLKALEKDRNRRYGSAGDLANDVRNVLANRPVSAGAPSRAYRAKKFVLRHRLGVTAASLVVLALVAGILGTSVGLVRARAAQRVAQEEAETARQVSDFLVDLFEVSDPDRARGNKVTAREILDAGAARISRQLASRPLVQARLMETMGEVYDGLGQYEQARRLFVATAQLRRGLIGPDHPDTLRAESLTGWTFARTGDASGVAILTDVLSRQEHVSGPDDLETARTRYRVGALLARSNQPGAAEPYLRAALAVLEARDGQGAESTLWCRTDLGMALFNLGRTKEALVQAEVVLAVRERASHGGHELGNALNNVAYLRLMAGEPAARVLDLARRALEISEKVLGPDHPRVAHNRHTLAEVLRRTGDLSGSRHQLAKALEVQERNLSEDDVYTATTRASLARVEFEMGRVTAAKALLRRALAALPPESPERNDAVELERRIAGVRDASATGRTR